MFFFYKIDVLLSPSSVSNKFESYTTSSLQLHKNCISVKWVKTTTFKIVLSVENTYFWKVYCHLHCNFLENSCNVRLSVPQKSWKNAHKILKGLNNYKCWRLLLIKSLASKDYTLKVCSYRPQQLVFKQPLLMRSLCKRS